MSVTTDAWNRIATKRPAANPTAPTSSSVGTTGNSSGSGTTIRRPAANPTTPASSGTGLTGSSSKTSATSSGIGVSGGSYPQGNLVRVNTYMPKNGVYDVDWNPSTKQVLIAGNPIAYHHIDDDGNAWAYESVLEGAYAKQNLKSLDDMFGRYNESQDRRMEAYERMMNEKWNYDESDLMNDVAWKAYQNMYTREANRAYEDALSQAAARTGGNISSMARSQAAQQRDYFLSKMGDAIPTITQQAYNRWLNDRNSKLDILDRQESIDTNRFNTEFALDETQRTRLRDNQDAARNRITDAIELDALKSDAGLKKAENTYQAAALVNRPFTADEAAYLGVVPNSDGTYPTPNQLVIDMQNEVWEEYEKGIMEYEQALQYSYTLAELAQKYEDDKNLAAFKNGLKSSAKTTTKTGSSTGTTKTSAGIAW